MPVVWRNIMKNEICPDCGGKKGKYSKRCRVCSNKGKNNPMYGRERSDEWRETQRKFMMGNIPWNKGKKGVQERTTEAIEKFRETHKVNGKMRGSKNPSKRPDVRKKLRLSMIEQRNKLYGQIHPLYNPNSISILEQKAKELGITDLQHAENGGEFYIKELGYWVDGYSKEKNIVIEYYEKHHNRQKEKDLIRQKEIEDYLGCEFIIIKEY